MNVEIGAEAAQFPEKEYINGIADAVCPVQCVHIVQVDMSARNTTKYCLCKFLLINGMYEEKTLSAIFTVLEPSTKKRFANTERPYCTAYCFVTNYCNDNAFLVAKLLNDNCCTLYERNFSSVEVLYELYITGT